MTVAELIERLKTLPQDAVVDVMKEKYSGWEGSIYEYQPLGNDDITIFSLKDGRTFVELGD